MFGTLTAKKQNANAYNVRDNGAVANAKRIADAAITTGTATLNSPSQAQWTAGDVGKSVWVAGAGTAGAWLTTTISAYVSATQVTLAANAGTTVSGANAAFGTDDSSKILATVNKAIAAGVNSVWIPGGDYFVDTVAIAKVGLTINGEKGATRIHSSTGANCFVATGISPESMAIRNIEFYGRGKNDAVGGSAIWFHDFGVESPAVVFADLYIHDWGGSAIKVGNPRSAYVAGNDFFNSIFSNIYTKNCGGNHIDIAQCQPACTFVNLLFIDVAPGKWGVYAESMTATFIGLGSQDNTRPANGADVDGGGGIFINTLSGVSTLLVLNSNFEAYGIDAIKITGPCQLTVQGSTFLDTSGLPVGGVKRTAINITTAQSLPTLLIGCQFNSVIGFKNGQPIHSPTASNLQVIGPSPTAFWSDSDGVAVRFGGMRLGYGFFAGDYTSYPHFDFIGIGNAPSVGINGSKVYADTATPTGANSRGDVVWDQGQASSYAGWICTVAGTPGTWVHFGPRENADQNTGAITQSKNGVLLTKAQSNDSHNVVYSGWVAGVGEGIFAASDDGHVYIGLTDGSLGPNYTTAGIKGKSAIEIDTLNRPKFLNPAILQSYTVANLPAAPPAGSMAYASNGRKVGEGAAAGTGVPVYYSNAAWRVYATDAAVAA